MKITENTTVNLTVLVTFIGGILWLTDMRTVANNAAAAAKEASDGVAMIQSERTQARVVDQKDISEIKSAIARVETDMQWIKKRLK